MATMQTKNPVTRCIFIFKNICGTTPTRNTVVVRSEFGTPVTTRSLGESIAELQYLNIERRPTVFTSTRIENGSPVNSDFPNVSLTEGWSSFDSFKCNINAVIEETVFKNTYNKNKGISLFAIRKGVHDFGYNPKKTKTQSRLYVRECLENGKFVQKTGHGANGSFRLRPTIHKNFIKAHKENRVHKIRNNNVTALCLKRFKRHDLEIAEALQSNVASLTETGADSRRVD